MHAIVLGSGFGSFKTYFEIGKSASFRAVLRMDYEELDGHDRKYFWCTCGGIPFLIISGKLHYYEGYTLDQIIAPLKYAVEELGVHKIMVTSASGGLSAKASVGQWMQLNQVVSLPSVNLNFPNSYLFYTKNHSVEWLEGMEIGTYAYHQGPSLGSVAEYLMLHQLGADLVGMSMLPEFYYLKSTSIESDFISLPVCSYYPYENAQEPEFEEVLEISKTGVEQLVHIFKQYIGQE